MDIHQRKIKGKVKFKINERVVIYMDKISFKINNWGRYAIFQILKMDE